MLRVIPVIITAAAISIFCLSGCKKGPNETDSGQDVKTIAEYQDEVTKTIAKYQQETLETADEYKEEVIETVAEHQEEVLKSSVEYQEDAQREITLENMEAELRKIEEELKRDLAEEN